MLGIVGAMQIEIDALKAALSDPVTTLISGMEFVRGDLDGCDVTVVVSGAGKVASAICTQTLIREFDADRVLNIGVAGTLCEDLGISDVAIALDVVQHDMDVTALGEPLGEIPGLKMIKIPCDPEMVMALNQAVKSAGGKCRIGTVASGDLFLHSTEKKKFIVDQFDAIAGEMEGAAVGQVCYVNHIPFAVLRTISDDAAGGAPASFEAFAAQAADFCSAIVRQYAVILSD